MKLARGCHLLAALLCGVAATLLSAWASAEYSPLRRNGPLRLVNYTAAPVTVGPKLLAGDPGWAAAVSLDMNPPPKAVHGVEQRKGLGAIEGAVYTFPLTDEAAALLKERGAVVALQREGAPSGVPPRRFAERVLRSGSRAQASAVLYRGWLLPTVQCELSFDERGALSGSRGLIEFSGGEFLPCTPALPGFLISVPVLGAPAGAALYLGFGLL